MDWSYNKKVNIAPGIKLNIRKRGVTSNIGIREASVKFGETGKYVCSGIPGTGYYTRGENNIPRHSIPKPKAPGKNTKGAGTIFVLICGIFFILTSLSILFHTGDSIGWWLLIFGVLSTWAMISRLRTKNTELEYSWQSFSKIKLEQYHDEELKILKYFIKSFELSDTIDEEQGIIDGINQQITSKSDTRLTSLLQEHKDALKKAQTQLNAHLLSVDEPLNEAELKAYGEMCKKFEQLLKSERVWYVNDYGFSLHAHQGQVPRFPASVYVGIFNYLKSDFDIPVFDIGAARYYIYPRYIIRANSVHDFKVLPLTPRSLNCNLIDYPEKNFTPKDSICVGRNDKNEPLYQYGYISILDGKTTQKVLFTNAQTANAFVAAFKDYIDLFYKEDIEIVNSDTSTNTKTNTIVNPTPAPKPIGPADIEAAATELFEYTHTLNCTPSVIEAINSLEQFACLDRLTYVNINPRLAFLVISDVIKCYKQLGYSLNFNNKEAAGPALFIYDFLDIANKPSFSSLKYKISIVAKYVNNHINALQTNFPDDKFFIVDILSNSRVKKEIVDKYVILLYRFASTLAKADGTISEQEKKCLRNIMTFSKNIKKEYLYDVTGKRPQHNNEQKKDAEAQLHELIGLDAVKEDIQKLTNYIKVQKIREKEGLKTNSLSYHCVFTGNPGTGKTTVARIVSEIYKELGILSEGHLVETDRSGLIAEYVGQTAIKTNRIIDQALDGVLFIQGGNLDYGNEAIATLLKRMEDDRDRLVVILAGYKNEMKRFIDSNPGLQSRFNRYIEFDDYTAEDLLAITKLNINKYDYILTSEAEEKIYNLYKYAVEHKDENFGNGRYARNILEKIMENQATRLAAVAEITKETLRTIVPEDIPDIEQ